MGVETRTGPKGPEQVKKLLHCHQVRKKCPEEGGLTCAFCLSFYCKLHLEQYDPATQVIPSTGWKCYYCLGTCSCSQCRLPPEERAKPKRKPKRKREANKGQENSIEITMLQEELHQREADLENVKAEQEKLKAEHEKLKAEQETLMADLEQEKYKNSELQEALAKGEEDRKKLTKKILELKGKLRVVCRVRPAIKGLSKMEFRKERELIGESVAIGKEQKYTFSKVFLEDSSQEEIFDEISDLIQSAIDFDDVCIFSFGQTGSGKTHTMIGKEGDNRGIIPRSLEKIFSDRERLKELGWDYTYQVSMVEIYRDEAYDMLRENDSRERVPVKYWQHPDLRWWPVDSEEAYRRVLNLAREKRVVSATHKNAESSRSHLVITFKLTGFNGTTEFEGTLSMIDLAGNEDPSECQTTVQYKEATGINLSLVVLRSVLKSLCKNELPNYKEGGSNASRLTMLLKPYLSSPKSKIFMVVNVSPEESSRKKSVESLKVSYWVDPDEKEQNKYGLMSSSKPRHGETSSKPVPGRSKPVPGC